MGVVLVLVLVVLGHRCARERMRPDHTCQPRPAVKHPPTRQTGERQTRDREKGKHKGTIGQKGGGTDHDGIICIAMKIYGLFPDEAKQACR